MKFDKSQNINITEETWDRQSLLPLKSLKAYRWKRLFESCNVGTYNSLEESFLPEEESSSFMGEIGSETEARKVHKHFKHTTQTRQTHTQHDSFDVAEVYRFIFSVKLS